MSQSKLNWHTEGERLIADVMIGDRAGRIEIRPVMDQQVSCLLSLPLGMAAGPEILKQNVEDFLGKIGSLN